MIGDRCRCGCTAEDRAKTADCRIPGCPYPNIARAPLRIGDRVPMPPRKLDIRPAPCSDNRPSFKPSRNGKK